MFSFESIVLAEETAKKASTRMPTAVFVVLIILIVLAFLVLVYFLYFVYKAKKDQVLIVERNGKFRAVVGEKRYYAVPFIDSVAATIDLRPQTIDFKNHFTLIDSKEKCYTVKISLTYKVKDAQKYHYNSANFDQAFEAKTESCLAGYFATKEIKGAKDLRNVSKPEVIEEIAGEISESFGVEILDFYFNEIEA